MLKVIVIGEPGLFRSLLCAHIEAEAPGALLPYADEDGVEPIQTSFPTVALILDRNELSADEAAALIQRVRTQFGGLPICIVSERSDRHVMQRLLNSGAQGLISMRSCAASLLPILNLVASGETFLPFSTFMSVTGAAETRNELVVEMRQNDGGIRLTTREQQVAEVLFRGRSNKEIARELTMCENTVKIHVRSLLKKLGARSRSEAIVIAQSKLPRASLAAVA